MVRRHAAMVILGPGLAIALSPAAAQTAPPTVGNAATPATTLPIPAAPAIVLPGPSATPSPVPTDTPTARTAPVAAPSPTPRATPRTPRPTPTSTPAAVPIPTPTATAMPSPAATPSPVATAPAPMAIVTATAPLQPADQAQRHYWLAALAAAVIAAAALAWALLRRRRADPVEAADGPLTVAAAPVAAAGPRARLALTFRPLRAGINLLSATSENEIVLANTGDAPAEDVRVLVRLLSAHAGQDADLAAFYAEPIGRPAVPAFALAAGETRALSAVAALPREALRPLTAAGRPIFVPVVAVNVTYVTGGVAAQLAQAFAVGVERVDSAKLAPFWLDAPARTYDQVAARPHAAPLER